MRLLERIKSAIKAGKVEYWSDRPENYTRQEFDLAIERDPDFSALVRKERESAGGDHGLDGEDYVYAGTIKVSMMNKVKNYYLKFFFWKKGEAQGQQGVTVQSFKNSE